MNVSHSTHDKHPPSPSYRVECCDGKDEAQGNRTNCCEEQSTVGEESTHAVEYEPLHAAAGKGGEGKRRFMCCVNKRNRSQLFTHAQRDRHRERHTTAERCTQ